MAGKHLTYKEQALEAARDLSYSKEVVDKIVGAQNDLEIIRIMANAREKELSNNG